MFEEDFQTDGDEDGSGEKLDFAFEEMAELVAYVHARERGSQGYQAYDDDGQDDGHIQKGKGYADGQGVDAGGNREHQQDVELEGVDLLFVGLELEGFINHFGPDKGQQGEGYPVVEFAD